MSARWINIVIFLFLSTSVFSQKIDNQVYHNRSAAIDSLMADGDYNEVAPLLDEQIKMLIDAEVYDSLYHYTYNTARATWKTNDAQAGHQRIEELFEVIKKHDKNPHHHLQVLNDMSWVYYESGDFKKAVHADSSYLKLCLQFEDVTPRELFMAHYNVGFGLMNDGKPRDAAAHFEQSIEPLLSDTVKFSDDLINSYNALGAALFRRGNYDGAERSFNKSLELIQLQEDQFQKAANAANIYGNLSLINQDKLDFIGCKENLSKAIQYRSKSLRLAENEYYRDQERDHLMKNYRGLASVYLSLGEFSKALKLLDYVKAEREKYLEANDPKLHLHYESYGSVQLAMGNLNEALDNLKRYADLCLEEHGDKSFITGIAFKRLGQIYAEMDDHKNALDVFGRAVETLESAEDPQKGNQLASTLQHRSLVLSKHGKTKEAIRDIDRAIEILKRSREGFDQTIGRAYTAKAEIHLENRQLKLAEEAVQKSLDLQSEHLNKSSKLRSSTFLPEATLIKARIQLAKDPNDTDNLKDALATAMFATRQLAEGRYSFDKDESQVWYFANNSEIFDFAKSLNFQLHQLTGEKQYLENLLELSETSKMLLLRNQLNNFSSLEFANIPDSVVQSERLLLDSLKRLELEPQNYDKLLIAERKYRELKQKIKDEFPEYYTLKFSDNVPDIENIREKLLSTNENLIVFSEGDSLLFGTLVTGEHLHAFAFNKIEVYDLVDLLSEAIIKNDQAQVNKLSYQLYENIFQPFESLMMSNQVLIIPDGKLFNLNFEALRKSEDSKSENYLLYDYSISYLLSATTSIQFNELQTSAGGLLAIAPGFEEDQKAEYRKLMEDSMSFDGSYLTLLQQPFAMKTAQNIASIFPGKAMLQGQATEEKFRENAEHFGILHFGTHAEINHQSPLLSRLILNASGSESTDDGMLHAYEIYNMKLRSELAVLSACQTGTGKAHSSEGVMSLAHSFVYAGCPSVVMSLWQIDEKTSSQIIEHFYENLAKGMTKVEALRQAKMQHLNENDSELNAPYYWAGLVLLGDTAALNSPPQPSDNWIWWILAAIFLASLSVIIWKRNRAQTKN